MFKIYFRDIFLSLNKNFIFTLFGITSVALINQINLITSSGIRFNHLYLDIAQMCLQMVPYIFSILIPFCVFVSTMMLLYQYRKENRIIFLQNLALSPTDIYKPFYCFVSIILIIHYVLSIVFVPIYYESFKRIQNELQQKHITSFIEPGVIRNFSSNLAIYVNKRKNDNLFEGIFISNTQEKNVIRTFSAKEGRIYFMNSEMNFELYDGFYQEIRNARLTFMSFQSYSIEINNHTHNIIKQVDPNSMSIIEMISFNDTKNDIFTTVKSLLHQKIIWPLYSIVFLILSLKFEWEFFYRSYIRTLNSKALWITIGVGIIFTAVNFFSQNLSIKFGYIGIVFMYLAPISLLQIAFRMLKSFSKKFS